MGRKGLRTSLIQSHPADLAPLTRRRFISAVKPLMLYPSRTPCGIQTPADAFRDVPPSFKALPSTSYSQNFQTASAWHLRAPQVSQFFAGNSRML
ncbi:hypothetical protein GJAV_G00057320 [Gymnothorax javanicus]|nr:hypothetical protein GJAV_G00057320 [Gymnothorax javanicus]